MTCKHCGGDTESLFHALHCDGRQGKIEANLPPAPPARITRPRDTSVQAFYNAVDSGLIETRQQQAYAALAVLGISTPNEVFERVRQDYPGDPTRINAINPRFAELRDMGVIREVGKRPCRVTGQECITWEVIPSSEHLAAVVVVRCETCGQIVRRELVKAS